MRLLARRTAEMHVILASEHENPAFAPEPLTGLYRRSPYQSLRGMALTTLDGLESAYEHVDPQAQGAARQVLEHKHDLLQRYEALRTQRMQGWRIRCHGNFHLAEVLRAGEDFVFIDFEGEATLPVYERRLKAHPLMDAVSLLRSLCFAARMALERLDRDQGGPVQADTYESAMRFWRYWVSVAFLQEYRRGVQPAVLFPSADDLPVMFLLAGRTVYELAYALRREAAWLSIPIADLPELLGGRS